MSNTVQFCSRNGDQKVVEVLDPAEGSVIGDIVHTSSTSNAKPEEKLNPKRKIWEKVQVGLGFIVTVTSYIDNLILQISASCPSFVKWYIGNTKNTNALYIYYTLYSLGKCEVLVLGIKQKITLFRLIRFVLEQYPLHPPTSFL